MKNNLLIGAFSVFSLPVFAGGIIGGGGGTILPNPAAVDRIRGAISESKVDLVLLANSLSTMSPEMMPTLWPKLFDGEKKIQSVIVGTKIEVLDSKACRNPVTGEEEDAAAPGSTPDSVCISVSRIAPKLTDENYRPQILALLFHEFAHLLGADEIEAEGLQRFAIARLRTVRSTDAYNLLVTGPNGLGLVWAEAGALHFLTRNAEKQEELCERVTKVEQKLSELDFHDEHFLLFDRRGVLQYRMSLAKVGFLKEYICAFEHADVGRRLRQYEEYFRGKSELKAEDLLYKAEDLLTGFNPGDLSWAENFRVRKITDRETLIQETQDVEELLKPMWKQSVDLRESLIK